MARSAPAIAQLLENLRSITTRTQDSRVIVAQVRLLVLDLALSKTWLEAKHYECDPDQGFGAHLLHEEPDHTLAVFAGAWLPGRGAPPHNHGTWAVVAGVDGVERNMFWTRVDDGAQPGFADIRKHSEQLVGPGDVVTFQPDSIHSVVNDTGQVSVSLHVYGRHVNHTHRFRFDPDRKTEAPFVLKVK
jgi:predicted metal-dependent enzyme (double-stranded beta helix superfamily)